MLRNIRLVLSFIYVLLFMTLVIMLPGCGTDERTVSVVSASDVHTAPLKAKPTSLVVVDTWARGDGKATGMDIMVYVVRDDVGVDSVTLTYADGTHCNKYVDMCCDWVRLEDNKGITWGSEAKGTALLCYPPTDKQVLTKGTWVARMYFLGEVPPMARGCACTELLLSGNK